MILTTHALTGAVIGKNIQNPWLVIALSLLVHFIMDSFRHGEYVEVFSKSTSIKNSGWKVTADLIIGFSIVLCLFFYFGNLNYEQFKNILLGMIASTFPDFVTFLYWKFRWGFLKKYYAFHSWMHKYPRYSPERAWTWRNARNDIIISALAIILLFVK